MNRTRPLEALLAALATFTVALPLLTLFDDNAWVRPSLVVIAVVALTGIGLRSLTPSRWLVIGGQLVLAFLAVCWMHGRGHLYAGVLPGPDTIRSFGILLGEAQQTVLTYSAPVPTERGVVVAITMLVGLTALVVDALGVTLRSPAFAGLGLLTAYLISATNSGEGLSWKYFILPVAFWLALLASQGIGSVRRWGTAVPRSADGSSSDPVLGVAGAARLLGVSALALAILVPNVVPHFPTTFVADGLGRADNGRGGGSISLNSTVDLRRSLESQSLSPVLTYSTTATTADPLRVAILTDYRRGEWSARYDANTPLDAPEPLVADRGIDSTEINVDVTESRLSAPQIAFPTPLTKFDIGEQRLLENFVGGYEVTEDVREYTASYAQLAPDDSDFTTDGQGPPGGDLGVFREVDGDSFQRLSELVDTVVPQDATPLETARLLQAHFRSSQYNYSLQLPTPTDPVSGRTMMSDPLSNFLITRTGYCVQFATAFVMAARLRDIPARMAIGFLPGTRDIDETYTVRAADAHAWPELWFPEIGWTRFEPTPGSRTDAAPEYSLLPSEEGPSATPTPTATSAAPAPTQSERPDSDLGAETPTALPTRSPVDWLAANALTIAVVLAVILSLLLVPVAAWVRRRRLRTSARDDAERVEADWAALISRLGDIGFSPPSGSTPRQAGTQLTHDALLSGDSKEAMGRVVATVERARYAPPRASIDDVSRDTREIWKAAVATRQRSDRLRAYLLPGDGLRQWRDVKDAVAQWPRATWERLRRR